MPLDLLTSPRGQAMVANLPPLYDRAWALQSLLQAIGLELDALVAALDAVLDSWFAQTAPGWALDRWERVLGLPPRPGQPDAERRSRIISHLRGYGTATITVVKNLAQAYDNGEIDIAEDHAGYTITVYFVSTRGVPPNLDDLKAAVRAVVPAHLAIQYEFNYTVWDEVDARAWTWDQIDGLSAGGPAGAPLTWDQWDVLL